MVNYTERSFEFNLTLHLTIRRILVPILMAARSVLVDVSCYIDLYSDTM